MVKAAGLENRETLGFNHLHEVLTHGVQMNFTNENYNLHFYHRNFLFALFSKSSFYTDCTVVCHD